MTTQAEQDTGGLARHGQRVAAMAADPELTGPLLAVGVAMSAIIDGKLDERLTLKRINNLAFGPPRNPHRGLAVRYLEVDIRRYKPPEPFGTCGAPTPRKSRCDRKASRKGCVTDWASGEMSMLEACSRHVDWFERNRREDQESKPEVGGPLPYANTGGKLARHFPEVDWPGLWSKIDPKWQEHPERDPVEPCTPTLTVLTEEPKPVKQRAEKSRKQQVQRRAGLYAVPDPGK